MNKKNISNKLNTSLFNDFVSVNVSTNPVTKNLESLTYEQKLTTLCQYTIFPKNIISMLVAATYSLSHHSWNNVVQELNQNISEEMGAGDGKIAQFQLPHYTILRKVFQDGFGIDINNIEPIEASTEFVEGIKTVLSSNTPEIVCGAVYALESSAIPELSLVKSIATTALDEKEQPYPSLMMDFFDWHINDIEVAHRDRLLEMADMEINSIEGWANFEEGFRIAMSIMDKWWTALSKNYVFN